ncbi:hypothetical protein KDAU_55410 [Dictyobacter aurantiacus]|uniref:Uncharacterized protein n=1 Tax=Dictyobacter aurantiacus TaxID=1936993 RepID=A0A401ZMX8_9CHLR|nr:hypothetical protein KDAU_55410 [Dictyobacter aurantiacus]
MGNIPYVNGGGMHKAGLLRVRRSNSAKQAAILCRLQGHDRTEGTFTRLHGAALA